MEILRSITVESVPTFTTLVKFALVETLQAFRTVLLYYPLNVFLLSLLVLLTVRKITSFFRTKQQFRAVYDPLPHHDTPLEDIKLIKKQIRGVQTDLIGLLKRGEGSEQRQESVTGVRQEIEGISEEVQRFLEEVNEKSGMLEEVERELNQTSRKALEQISRINAQSDI